MSKSKNQSIESFEKCTQFIRSDIIALLMDIETNRGKIKRISQNSVKNMNLTGYRGCSSEQLADMLAKQIPDHTKQQFEVLCDLAWYGCDYQSMLWYLNPGSGRVHDFRGSWAKRAFEGRGSNWIIGQYAMAATIAERSSQQWAIGPKCQDWSKIMAAYLKNPHYSDNFCRTGLSVSKLLGKCNDTLLLRFLGEYGALADSQSYDAAYKWDHLNTPDRLLTSFTPDTMSRFGVQAPFTKISPDQTKTLAVLRNGFVLTESASAAFSTAA